MEPRIQYAKTSDGVDIAYAIAGAADIDRRGAAGRLTVRGRDIVLEPLDRRRLDQADGAAAEARPGQARAVEARHALRRFDQRVQLRDAHLVVVAQTGVRLVHQPAEGDDIAAFERRGAAQHPVVLGDHVAGARAHRHRQRSLVQPKLVERDIA